MTPPPPPPAALPRRPRAAAVLLAALAVALLAPAAAGALPGGPAGPAADPPAPSAGPSGPDGPAQPSPGPSGSPRGPSGTPSPSPTATPGEHVLHSGDGGVFLAPDPDLPADARAEAATCPGCGWRLTVPCAPDAGACKDLQPVCAAGRRMRAWLQASPSAAWRLLGTTCVEAGGPLSRSRLEDHLRGLVGADVPVLRPAAQPRPVALVGLPVVFDTGQAHYLPSHVYGVAQYDVDLTLQPVWDWDFGDGGQLRTTQHGGHWPVRTVTHVYRRAGDYQVQVVAGWAVEYEVAGMGPFLMARNVRQQAPLAVTVRPAAAVLVARP